MAANAAYGVLQLLAARAGFNLDAGAHAAHRRGELDQHLRRRRRQTVYRPNALTGDPNHLGIMLMSRCSS